MYFVSIRYLQVQCEISWVFLFHVLGERIILQMHPQCKLSCVANAANRIRRIEKNHTWQRSNHKLLLRKNWSCNHTGVVWFTVSAFLTDNVEEYFSRIITVITQNPNLQSDQVKWVKQVDQEAKMCWLPRMTKIET